MLNKILSSRVPPWRDRGIVLIVLFTVAIFVFYVFFAKKPVMQSRFKPKAEIASLREIKTDCIKFTSPVLLLNIKHNQDKNICSLQANLKTTHQQLVMESKKIAEKLIDDSGVKLRLLQKQKYAQKSLQLVSCEKSFAFSATDAVTLFCDTQNQRLALTLTPKSNDEQQDFKTLEQILATVEEI